MEKSESRRVFVVHGQEEEKKEAVAKFLGKLDLEPVILHEQPSHGVTLIEKFENYSDVVFAVIVLTGDDYGYPKGKPEESKPRPRQNVVFELGFLMGRFAGKRVYALHEEGLELPSDYQGLVFIPYDAAGIWKLLIARAMKTANIEIDLNKAV
jgi:predicted nucleotide-binding protein